MMKTMQIKHTHYFKFMLFNGNVKKVALEILKGYLAGFVYFYHFIPYKNLFRW